MSGRSPLSERSAAAALARSAAAILLDFDGPVTRLFPGDSWKRLSARIRSEAVTAAEPQVAAALAVALGDEPDHVQCLRTIARLAPATLREMTALSTQAEWQVARRARPYPAALRLMEETLGRGAAVAIVTNNDPGVVPLVLERAQPGLTGRLAGVHGRSPGAVADLKPAPALIQRALADCRCPPGRAVLLGDSVTDVAAGQAAGVSVIGVSEDAERRQELLSAGAVHAFVDVDDLLVEMQVGAVGHGSLPRGGTESG